MITIIELKWLLLLYHLSNWNGHEVACTLLARTAAHGPVLLGEQSRRAGFLLIRGISVLARRRQRHQVLVYDI